VRPFSPGRLMSAPRDSSRLNTASSSSSCKQQHATAFRHDRRDVCALCYPLVAVAVSYMHA
jgi:hypothetical protein